MSGTCDLDSAELQLWLSHAPTDVEDTGSTNSPLTAPGNTRGEATAEEDTRSSSGNAGAAVAGEVVRAEDARGVDERKRGREHSTPPHRSAQRKTNRVAEGGLRSSRAAVVDDVDGRGC